MSTTENAGAEMPKYRCHKEVHALKIAKILPHDDGTVTIQPADEGFAPLSFSKEYIEKHGPKEGWYYVVYEDGYESFSPSEAFENGYELI